MYDAFTNTVSWVSLLLGSIALWRVLFPPYDRALAMPIGVGVFCLLMWVIVRAIESKLTSQHLSTLGKGRNLIGFWLALGALVLVATANPTIDPQGQPRVERNALGNPVGTDGL